MNERFGFSKYTLRRKVFQIFGASFQIFGPDGSLVFYSKQKAFRLKEDIRLYADQTMQDELLLIKARQIIDFAAAYDVVDTGTGYKIGALKRKGIKSLFRDSWVIMDAYDREIGMIKEDSPGLAIIRRYVFNLIPQKFNVIVNNGIAATLEQRFNPFIFWMDINFADRVLERRLGMAAAVLIAAIENRQR